MGTTGSVGYLFHKKGRIVVKASADKFDDVELAAIDAGAEDIVRYFWEIMARNRSDAQARQARV